MSRGVPAGRFLQRALRSVGVQRMYGPPLAGLPVVPVRSARVAALIAEADRRLHGGIAAMHLGDGVVRVGSAGPQGRPGDGPAGDCEVSSAAAMRDVAADLPSRLGREGCVDVRLTIDPAERVDELALARPAVRDGWVDVDPDARAALAAARAPLLLVGPGIVLDGAIPGLHALAVAGQLGVLNTWGAKGVFDWRSRHHLATAGLQAHDFRLAGVADADLVVTSGLDELEAPAAAWRRGPALDLPTGMLGPLAEQWRRDGQDGEPSEIAVPPLRARLGAVTQAGWAATSMPLPPTRVTRHYGDIVAAGGVVAADPGTAGYWVARTLATTAPASVHVPARRDAAGFAVACVIAARLATPDRPALAVVDSPRAGIVDEVLGVAGELGIPVGLEEWDSTAPEVGADDHHARCWAMSVAGATVVAAVATDPRQLDEMVEAAGPVTAWTA